MDFEFPAQQRCPKCGAVFEKAPLQAEFVQGSVAAGEAPVVACPHCSALLWRPGLDPDSPLHPFDPDADSDGI